MIELNDFQLPPRASDRTIDEAVRWFAERVSRVESSAARRDGEIMWDSPELLPPTEWTPEVLKVFKSKRKASVQPPRKRDLGDCNLGAPKPGPPDLHAAVLTFPARLLTYVNELWGGNGPLVYRRARVSRKVYSRLTSNNLAAANKDTVMKFAIGLQLDREKADLLMRSAGYSFSSSIPWDLAFVYCIENRIWNLDDLNEILSRNGYEVVKLD